jgi:DNA-binding transcriptional LysR family regulator
MAGLDWSDLRYALAIGQHGSVGAAARRLGVNATTVQRRLEALEQGLGARLFDRSRNGYQPTEAGALVLEQAQRMADRADEIERHVMGRDRELTGPLRVTTAFVIMEHLLPGPLSRTRSWSTCRAATPTPRRAWRGWKPMSPCVCRPTSPNIWSAASWA